MVVFVTQNGGKLHDRPFCDDLARSMSIFSFIFNGFRGVLLESRFYLIFERRIILSVLLIFNNCSYI